MRIKFPPVVMPFDQPGVVDGKGSHVFLVITDGKRDALIEAFSDAPGKWSRVRLPKVVQLAKGRHRRRRM